MSTDFIILKEAALTNNCPECYSTEGLTLSFKQKKVASALIHRVTSEVVESLYCDNCHTHIYPVRWTDDIERVYDYHKKTVKPMKSSFKLTPLFIWLLIIDALLIAGVIVYVNYPHLLGIEG